MPRKPGRMRDAGDKAFRKTDKELEEKELKLLLNTSIDWEAMRPEVHDRALYDQLIKVVDEATRNNDSLAQLKTRLETSGNEGIELARKVISLIL